MTEDLEAFENVWDTLSLFFYSLLIIIELFLYNIDSSYKRLFLLQYKLLMNSYEDINSSYIIKALSII